jgi:hypothetical protein
LIKAGERIGRSEIYTLISYVWNKEELLEQYKESIVVPIYKKGDETDCINYRGISLSLTTCRRLSKSCCQDQLHIQRKLLVIISVDFDTKGRLLIMYSALVKYLRKMGIQ